MLRGFRWQFIAFVISLILFFVSFVIRSNNQTIPPQIVRSATPAPTTQPTAILTDTLAPTAENAVSPTTVPSLTSSVFREGLVGRVQYLNPLLADLNPVDRDISSLIFEGLTRTNEFGESAPALAREWIISSDGLEYVFFLQEDILWQDGIPFTADDVLFTASLLSDVRFPWSRELYSFWRTVETQKLDEYVVRFRLTQPLASFPNRLTIGILPEHALAGTSADQIASHPFNLTPIGTGPYQLKALRSTTGSAIDPVELELSPVYQQREDGQTGFAIEQIHFQLYESFDHAVSGLQNHEIDGLATRTRNERSSLLDIENVHTYTSIEPTIGMLIYNWDEEDNRFFRDKRVRLGLQTGLDRTSIIETHLPNQAIPADSPLLPGSWAYASDLLPIPYDPTQAITYFDTANIQIASETVDVPEGEPTPEPTSTPPDAPRYRFTILSPDDTSLAAIAEGIASQWSQYNLIVSVEVVTQEQFAQRLETSDFDAALIEIPMNADSDVYSYWHQGQQYPEGNNYGAASDPSISEWLERARQESNGINRVTLYSNFQRDFIEQAIAIPMYYPLHTYAVHSNFTGIQIGFISSPTDRFRTINEWQIRAG